MRFLFCYLISVFFVAGCGNIEKGNVRLNRESAHANGFMIEKSVESAGVTKVTIFNPWEEARDVSVDYYLVNGESEICATLIGKRIIRTPVERVICLSTTHLAYLEVLGENKSVVGISGSQYVSNPVIRDRMDLGNIPDVGYGQNLNYEMMIQLKPDLVLLYGIGSEVTSYSRKLEELGIPVVMVAEYLEETPLGKTEWIKFIGAFFEKDDLAAEYFEQVEEEYYRLKNLVKDRIQKPEVLVGSPYKDAWWVPGGNSYMANLIADAGGNYIGRKNTSHESYVISFENAIAWGNKADIWINMGNLGSKHEVIAADQRLQSLKVFGNGKMYNNINRLSTHGGNDFWESGTVNPHIVLRDLISVFHPGLVEDELVYYKEIK